MISIGDARGGMEVAMGRCRCDYWYCGRRWCVGVGGLSRCGGRKCGGSWGEDGGCRWWWWMGMLCCAALLLSTRRKPAQSSHEGRKRQSQHSGPPQTCSRGSALLRSPHTKFMLPLLSSPSSSFLQPRPPTQIIVFAARLSS